MGENQSGSGNDKNSDCLQIAMDQYGKLRDEISVRISLQNQMSERALNLTFWTVTVLASLFAFFMADFQPGASEKTLSMSDRLGYFVNVAIPILGVYNLLLILIHAAWIYQVGMIFRITRYWNWIVAQQLVNLVPSAEELFRWDRRKKNGRDPWILEVDEGWIRFFQVALLVALTFLGLLGLAGMVAWRIVMDRALCGVIPVLGVISFVVLLVLSGIVVIVLLRVKRGDEASESR